MVFWPRHKPRADGVQEDVAQHCKQMDVVFNDDMAKAPLKQMAHPLVPPIAVAGEATFELLHKLGKVAVWRPNDKMKMIPHLVAGQDSDVIPLVLFNQNF